MRRLPTFLRSTVAGGAATFADLAVLMVAVSAFHISPRIASVPALLIGAAVSFAGHRTFAFRARSGHVGKQLLGFIATEIVTLVLNAVIFDFAVRATHPKDAAVGLLRVVVQSMVYVGWSYPVWKRVFATPAAEPVPQATT